ncbi:MAG: LacI family DNA-binding transcriptional regulator [Phycisphaeraceae bacterium]|nr:LacI family DNA-binding transcriptional regulator [Phycisphaeraceae bacterium]
MSNIREIARIAKVSPTTVSLVINDRGRVGEVTRQRVRDAMEQLGYAPRGQGRPKPKVQVWRLAILFAPSRTGEMPMLEATRKLIYDMRQAALGAGATVDFFGGMGHFQRDGLFSPLLTSDELDGVILLQPSSEDGYQSFILEHGVPLVIFDRRPVAEEFSFVAVDGEGGCRQAIDHLWDLGHRRIAVLHQSEQRPHLISRHLAAVDALRRHGVEPAAVEPVDRNDGDDVFDQKARRVLSTGATAALVICGQSVVRCMNSLNHLGLDVPGDFSIVGFDDLGLQSAIGQQATAITADRAFVAQALVQTLLELLDQRERVTFRGVTVRAYLSDHGTTGPCRSLNPECHVS